MKKKTNRLSNVRYREAIASMDDNQFQRFVQAMEFHPENYAGLSFESMRQRAANVVDLGFCMRLSEKKRCDEWDDKVFNAIRAALGDYNTVDYMIFV